MRKGALALGVVMAAVGRVAAHALGLPAVESTPSPVQSCPAQPQAVAHHAHAAQRHRRSRDHGIEQEAVDGVQHARRDGDTDDVVDEGPEKVLADGSDTVRRESWMARGMASRSVLMSVMRATSMAMSLPLPMAMPTSALASAWPSLMPSPTSGHHVPLLLQACDEGALVLGQHLAAEVVDAHRLAHGLRGTPRIARLHVHLDARFLQAVNCLRCAGLDAVGDGHRRAASVAHRGAASPCTPVPPTASHARASRRRWPRPVPPSGAGRPWPSRYR